MYQQQISNTFRTTLKSKAEAELLAAKYRAYKAQGMLVLVVTLSTYLSSDSLAASGAMPYVWNEHFIRRVRRYLPWQLKQKIDSDYVLEQSPDGYWHYHGFIAIPVQASHKIWRDGMLNPRLKRDLDLLKAEGKYRYFPINKHLIEPVRDGYDEADWAGYMTKTDSYISSAG